MDLSSINQIIGPANLAVSQNMSWLNQYNQSTSGTTSSSSTPTYASTTSYPSTYDTSGMDAQYMQAMMQQMQTMMSQMQQMQQEINSQEGSGYGSGQNTGGGGWGYSGGYGGGYSGGYGTMQQAGTNAASQQIENMIATGTTNSSSLSSTDVAQLLTAVQNGQFSPSDLTTVFQGALVNTTDPTQLSNLTSLFTSAEQNHLVSYNQTFSPGFLTQLPTTTASSLTTAIANQGLLNTNGSTNTDLSRFLLSASNQDGNPYQTNTTYDSPINPRQLFAQGVVQQMVNTFFSTTPIPSTPETQRLTGTLQMMGFQFNSDGTLNLSANDPFTLTAPTTTTT